MAANNAKSEIGSDWLTIVSKSGTREFAAAFTTNAVIEASVLNQALSGPAAIDAFFVATAHGLYESLRFTAQTVDSRKTYLEWEGTVFGKEVGGTTILTRDATGLIESIQLYHRPLQVVLEFSKELAQRLKGKIDPSQLAPPI